MLLGKRTCEIPDKTEQDATGRLTGLGMSLGQLNFQSFPPRFLPDLMGTEKRLADGALSEQIPDFSREWTRPCNIPSLSKRKAHSGGYV